MEESMNSRTLSCSILLEKSQKFKNIKIVNKNLISGVTKFKVRFKIELEIQTSPEKILAKKKTMLNKLDDREKLFVIGE